MPLSSRAQQMGLGRGRRGGVLEMISTLLAPVMQRGRGGIGGGVGAPGAGGAPAPPIQPSIMQSVGQALGQYNQNTAAYRGEQRQIETHELAIKEAERKAKMAEMFGPFFETMMKQFQAQQQGGQPSVPPGVGAPPPSVPAPVPPVTQQPLPGSIPAITEGGLALGGGLTNAGEVRRDADGSLWKANGGPEKSGATWTRVN